MTPEQREELLAEYQDEHPETWYDPLDTSAIMLL